MPYDCRIHSQKGGSHFSSTATIRRWKVSSLRPIQVVAFGAYSSTPRALAGLSILWRYFAHYLFLSCALIHGIQMFTEFVAECRAEKLKARLTELSVDTSTPRRKKQAVLEEAPDTIAVAA
jgi:hypothetical protein